MCASRPFSETIFKCRNRKGVESRHFARWIGFKKVSGQPALWMDDTGKISKSVDNIINPRARYDTIHSISVVVATGVFLIEFMTTAAGGL